MGLFDFLRKQIKMPKVAPVCSYSPPTPISNEEYQRKREAEINILEKKYDLTTVQGINSIPVPLKKQVSVESMPSVTGQIEYYLMLKAGQFEKSGEVELALACFSKANELMPMSATFYPYDTYMRLPRYLRKLRRFDEARVEETKIKAMFPNGGIFELTKSEFMSDMQSEGRPVARAEALYKEYKAERNAERQKEAFRLDYEWLWEFLPSKCPKSFSGYMRMKNANTEKFQSIVVEARKHGRLLL